MSKTTAALEAAVAIVIENTPKDGSRPTARQRANVDKVFHQILKLIAPRIRHFIRQYGLMAHWDDAEQCCAIGVHRAIQAYDPTKAQFTTFVNWQLRGELQSLRFRLMADQRPSAKKVEATTVSLHAVTTHADGEETSLEALIVDEEALSRTEAGAADYLAENARRALVDQYVEHLRRTGMETLKRRARARRTKVAAADSSVPCFRTSNAIDPAELAELETMVEQHRAIVQSRIFADGRSDEPGLEGAAKERVRQITKRAARTMAELAATDPRFAIMAETLARPTKRADKAATVQPEVGLLADATALHNQLATVVAVEANGAAAAALTIVERARPRVMPVH